MADDGFRTEAAAGHRDRRFHSGAPTHLDDDELERRTQRERADAGIDPYDRDDVPPATDAPVPADAETDEIRDIEGIAARQESEFETMPITEDNPFPPTRYAEE